MGAKWKLDISRSEEDYVECDHDPSADCDCEERYPYEWQPEVAYMFSVDRMEGGTLVKTYDNPALSGSEERFEDWRLVYASEHVPTLKEARELGTQALGWLATLNMPAIRNR